MRKLEEFRHKAEEAEKRAREAQYKAKELKNSKTGLTHQKKFNQITQETVVEIAEANVLFNEAQTALAEYMEKITEVMGTILEIGVMSIAANRTVVGRLELKLKNATKEEIDEYQRREIINVIKQLKEHQDIHEKQNKMSQLIRENRDSIVQQESATSQIREELYVRADKDDEHDKRLDEGDRRDDDQDERLKEGEQKDLEHDARLDAGDQKDDEQDGRIQALEQRVAYLESKLGAGTKVMLFERVITYVALALAVAGIVIGSGLL